MSEIDDIFSHGRASSSKHPLASARPTTTDEVSSSGHHNKNKLKKTKRLDTSPSQNAGGQASHTKKLESRRGGHTEILSPERGMTSAASPKEAADRTKLKKAKPRAVVQTFQDPEIAKERFSQEGAKIESTKIGKKSRSAESRTTRPVVEADDLEDFRNSKGTSKRKRTEEGYAIYTETELKLDQGGGTPLCPFDCTCCF